MRPADPQATIAPAWLQLTQGVSSDHRPDATVQPPTPAGDPSRSELPLMQLAHGEDVFGEFHTHEFLGEGGMGQVWRAWQGALQRDVAIKQTRPGIPQTAEDALVREARVLGSLEHPHIVPVHALGLDASGRVTMVMKRIRGVTWRTLLTTPAHPWWTEHGSRDPLSTHLNVLLAVCDAVHFAHTSKMLHLDLKLDNIMLGAFGEIYVLDWGLACPPGSTVNGIVGTPCYMAPEMLVPGAQLDVRTDVFLLGACLHHVLTGRPRYQGEVLMDVLAQAALAAPVQYPPELPAGLGRIANRACSCSPEERPASARDFARELSHWINQRASLAVAQAAAERLEVLRRLRRGEDRSSRRVEAELVFTECRFGFRTALSGSAHCEEAREGLEEALRLMVDLKLEAGEPEGAEALIGELEVIGIMDAPLLHAAVAIQRKVLEQRRNAMDLEIGARERFIVIRIFLLINTAIILTLMYYASSYTHAQGTIMAASLLAVLMASMVGFRKKIFLNVANISMAVGLVTVVAAITVLRVVAWRFDVALAPALITDIILSCVLVIWAATVMRWRLLWAGPPLALGAVAISLWPQEALLLYLGSNLANMLVMAVLMYSVPRLKSVARPQ